MDIGLLVLRIVVGLVLTGHGMQKLFGSFGGGGIAGTAQFFEAVGLRPGKLHATVGGFGEFVGGLLLAAGLLTPLAGLLLIAVMTAAILSVHLKHGLWSSNNGFELPLMVAAVAFAVVGVGPGGWSLDHLFSIELTGWGWAVGALVVGFLGGAGAVITGRAGHAEEKASDASTAA